MSAAAEERDLAAPATARCARACPGRVGPAPGARPAAPRPLWRRDLRRWGERRRRRPPRTRPRWHRAGRSAAARRASFRIGHGGEVAVVGRAYPTRARRIRAKLARGIAAGHRIRRALRQAALEGLALAGKAFAIESGIVIGARACAMRGKSRLVSVDEGHALGRGIAAALLAARERPDLGQKLLRHEVHRLTRPLAIDGEGGMHVEAIASA